MAGSSVTLMAGNAPSDNMVHYWTYWGGDSGILEPKRGNQDSPSKQAVSFTW